MVNFKLAVVVGKKFNIISKMSNDAPTPAMKMCIVTPSLSGGGAEKITVNLANYYTDIGYNVTILVFNTDDCSNSLKKEISTLGIKKCSSLRLIFKI